MRHLYSFVAGCVLVFILLQGWHAPADRYQLIWTGSRNTEWPDQVLRLDTSTGRIIGFHISGTSSHEFVEPTRSK